MNTTHAWAARAIHPAASVVAVDRPTGELGPQLLTLDTPRGPARAVLRTAAPEQAGRLVTEAAALSAAAAAGVPAPRLIAYDETGASTGSVAVLSTFVGGSSQIAAEPDDERLRATGRAVAVLAGTRAQATPALPRRDRSLADVDFDHSGNPLLLEARAALDELPMPAGPEVLVHGDLWQGNTMWDANTLTALIDWDAAGVGHPGIDLANVRCDAAVLFGVPAAHTVLDGWREVADDPEWLAYFDVVAALSTPADIGAFLPAMRAQGRADLSAATTTQRRDDYLREALQAL